jgi:hypothetical protein
MGRRARILDYDFSSGESRLRSYIKYPDITHVSCAEKMPY